uniref:Uncharacterized protein n=1 Tax=Octopus bimaculoides TaxID=37653 RepID=A0A0L8G243_OCTBM
MILIDPYKSRMEKAHTRRTGMYDGLAPRLRKIWLPNKSPHHRGGARSFVDKSNYDLIKRLSISGWKENQGFKGNGRCS